MTFPRSMAVGLFVFTALLLAALAGTAGAIMYFGRTPLDVDGSSKAVTIAEGTGFLEVSNYLAEQGIISSAKLFSLYLLGTGSFNNLQPGVYVFSGKMPPRLVRQYLVEGRTSAYRVTLVEGWAVRDMAAEFEKKGLFAQNDFLKAAEGKEGFLFPDTYQFKRDVTAEEVVVKLKENFLARTDALKPTKEQIILASIVEREAKHDEDRAKIAGVYTNRLKQGMKLEADPTVQYAKGSWEPITARDYKTVDSPYNTYLHEGLPPGPICNPGLKSIEAAVHPAEIDALYFFHLRDGTTIYSKTLDEHEQNKQKYRSER